jgi:hypothetical protein
MPAKITILYLCNKDGELVHTAAIVKKGAINR